MGSETGCQCNCCNNGKVCSLRFALKISLADRFWMVCNFVCVLLQEWWVELLVPVAVEWHGDVEPLAIQTQLDHLGAARDPTTFDKERLGLAGQLLVLSHLDWTVGHNGPSQEHLIRGHEKYLVMSLQWTSPKLCMREERRFMVHHVRVLIRNWVVLSWGSSKKNWATSFEGLTFETDWLSNVRRRHERHII